MTFYIHLIYSALQNFASTFFDPYLQSASGGDFVLIYNNADSIIFPFSLQGVRGLIVAFLTLSSTDLLYCYAIIFFIFYIIMKFFIDAIKFISMPFIIIKLNLCFPVAINTPTHAKISKLRYFRHFLDITMAGLALLLAYFYVLRMIKINIIRQVVNSNPLNLFTRSVI